MKLTEQQQSVLKMSLERHAADPNVVSIGIGHKRRAGLRTGEVGVVVGLKRKLPTNQVPAAQMIRPSYQGVTTDVEEYGLISVPPPVPPEDVEKREFTARQRPCPPGFSIGHQKVTAGTLGAWVHLVGQEGYHILSNNHVMAASNDAVEGDFIRQPGKYDGGTEDDRIARLVKYARVKFDNDDGGKKQAAIVAWKIWKAPANATARLVKCPYRLQVLHPYAIEQPYPNLIDAAVAKVILETWVDLEIPSIGEMQGIRDLELGDKVQKTGRTTEYTQGMVDVVGATSRVDYGAGKGVATFADQLVIRSDSGEFSAGGDSGSGIYGMDKMLEGLLFAGGSGVTIANRISNVVAILGVTV